MSHRTPVEEQRGEELRGCVGDTNLGINVCLQWAN